MPATCTYISMQQAPDGKYVYNPSAHEREYINMLSKMRGRAGDKRSTTSADPRAHVVDTRLSIERDSSSDKRISLQPNLPSHEKYSQTRSTTLEAGDKRGIRESAKFVDGKSPSIVLHECEDGMSSDKRESIHRRFSNGENDLKAQRRSSNRESEDVDEVERRFYPRRESLQRKEMETIQKERRWPQPRQHKSRRRRCRREKESSDLSEVGDDELLQRQVDDIILQSNGELGNFMQQNFKENYDDRALPYHPNHLMRGPVPPSHTNPSVNYSYMSYPPASSGLCQRCQHECSSFSQPQLSAPQLQPRFQQRPYHAIIYMGNPV